MSQSVRLPHFTNPLQKGQHGAVVPHQENVSELGIGYSVGQKNQSLASCHLCSTSVTSAVEAPSSSTP